MRRLRKKFLWMTQGPSLFPLSSQLVSPLVQEFHSKIHSQYSCCLSCCWRPRSEIVSWLLPYDCWEVVIWKDFLLYIAFSFDCSVGFENFCLFQLSAYSSAAFAIFLWIVIIFQVLPTPKIIDCRLTSEEGNWRYFHQISSFISLLAFAWKGFAL